VPQKPNSEKIKMKLIDDLEKIIGEKGREKLVNNKVYKWFVDATALNLYSLSFMANEMTLGGMNFTESLSTRAAAFFGNFAVGRPYGIYRDWVMKSLKIKEDTTRWIRWPLEVATFATGQTPFYVGFLMVGSMAPEIYQGIVDGDLNAAANAYQHINWDGVRNAATSLTLLSPLVGPTQGWTYDRIREQGGLKTTYEKSAESLE